MTHEEYIALLEEARRACERVGRAHETLRAADMALAAAAELRGASELELQLAQEHDSEVWGRLSPAMAERYWSIPEKSADESSAA